MKLELCYEKNHLTGEEFYWVKKDGVTVDGSMSRSLVEADKNFELIKKGIEIEKKILKTWEG